MKRFFKENIKFIIVILICVVGSGLSTYATEYLFNSSDVYYDNSTSGIQAGNVQSAIDELYGHATDYSELKSIIGNDSLTTDSQTLTGAVNELNNNVIQEIAGENYICYRFVNGIQIEIVNVSKKVSITTQWGNAYEGKIDLGNFPVPFVYTPDSVVLTNGSGYGWSIESISKASTETYIGEYFLWRPSAIDQLPVKIKVTAIGKWK